MGKRRRGEDLAIIIVMLGLIGYNGWWLADDLVSYGYKPVPAIDAYMETTPGTRRGGDFIEVSYAYMVDGRRYIGSNLFGPGSSQRATTFTMDVFKGWYAEWSKAPVVYHDASKPARSRMVVGLTSSGVLFFPVLLLAAGFGWAFFKRGRVGGDEDDGLMYRLEVVMTGGSGLVIACMVGQVIFLTKLWVEHAWLLHLVVACGTAIGLIVGFAGAEREAGQNTRIPRLIKLAARKVAGRR